MGTENENVSIIFWVPRSLKRTCRFFWSIHKGSIWWYNILTYNNGSILHLLQLDPITTAYVLLTDNLFALKGGYTDPILTMKIAE